MGRSMRISDSRSNLSRGFPKSTVKVVQKYRPFLRQVDNWNLFPYNAVRPKGCTNRRGERRPWVKTHQSARSRLRPDNEVRGASETPGTYGRLCNRRIRRMPLRALDGRVTRLTNTRATVEQKGRDRSEETSDCAFVLLICLIRRNIFPCVEL